MTNNFFVPSALNHKIEFEKFRGLDINAGKANMVSSSQVLFCKNCVISNQRPNSSIEFQHVAESRKIIIGFLDKENLCDACKTARTKQDSIDWEKRESELRQLCDKYRSRNGSYDCSVPGSGGKDIFFRFLDIET